MVDSAVMRQLPTDQMRAGTQVWSTYDSREDDRVAYWRERIRVATAGLFDISAGVELESFSARASLRRSGPFSFMAAESTVPLPVIRSRRDILQRDATVLATAGDRTEIDALLAGHAPHVGSGGNLR